jgi:esterase/lipase
MLEKILNTYALSKRYVLIGFISSLCVGVLCYRNYCYYHTFKNIERNYKKEEIWEDELEIYSVALPRFYTSSTKKKKCLLLIGGYKDIPYVWDSIQNYLITDKLDFYAPRTFGNGRSFFQVSNWKDWVITYLEAIYVLQEQYESIDIIGFSTGTVIALYLSQFKYKCTINNIILCAPFLLNKEYLSIKLFFSDNIFSKILNKICAHTIRFHPKSTSKFAGYRDTHHEINSINDYCEIFGDAQTETTLFEFIKFRPKQIIANNVVILYPNDDDIIGNIDVQHKIITKAFNNKHIDLISIPSYLNRFEVFEKNISKSNKIDSLPALCGHVMFKEQPEIIKNIYANLRKYLI